MPSELAAQSGLRQKEWEHRKKRIGAVIGDILEFTRKVAKDLVPDLIAIKEKELWKYGGHDSWESFCENGLGYSDRHIRRVLREFDKRNVLGISETGGHSVRLEDAKPAAETTIEPPASKPAPAPSKKRKEAPMKPANAREVEPDNLPPAANPEMTAKAYARALSDIIEAIDYHWSFDTGQQHTHSWHDKQDFLQSWREKINALPKL